MNSFSHPKGILSRLTAVLILALGPGVAQLVGQSTDPVIDSLVQRVSVDSLESYLRILTGLDSVEVADSVLVYGMDSLENVQTAWYADTVVALSRRVQLGNEVARYWLVEKLKSFGFDAVEVDDLPGSPWMQNIRVKKLGRTQPDSVYILCAHYDAVPPSPGADDNGSGTAALLEAARLLHGFQNESTIVLALWDAEEIGLVGSEYYAEQARADGRDIAGVINLDMIGWDGDKDRVTEIHADTQSASLGQAVRTVMLDYGLKLWPVNHLPGTRRSDHASFWNVGYPAVVLIEELFGGDFNPYYHSKDDLISNVDFGYMVENARLAVAAIATLAGNAKLVASEPGRPERTELTQAANWPNPFSASTQISFSAVQPGPAKIQIFDVRGRLVSEIDRPATGRGRQVVPWSPPDEIASGILLYRIETAGGSFEGMMVLAR